MKKITEFKSIFDLLKAFPNEKSCIDHLEKIRWNGVVISPFDETSKVYKCSGNKYRCKNTKKYFNVRTGTIFDNTKVPLQKWFVALYIFSSHKKGISSHQLAKDISVTQKTAWFLLHRLRYAFDHPNFKKILGEVVQADETYIGGKNKNRHSENKIDGSQGRSTKDKTPVLGVMQQNGIVETCIVKNTKAETIKPFIEKKVKEGSILVTDDWDSYNPLSKDYFHIVVDHNHGEYVKGAFHTNTIEGFWGLLKRGIYGIYHQVSPKHLDRYCTEFALRYNTRKFETQNRFDLILSSITNKHLTYKNLINHE